MEWTICFLFTGLAALPIFAFIHWDAVVHKKSRAFGLKCDVTSIISVLRSNERRNNQTSRSSTSARFYALKRAAFNPIPSQSQSRLYKNSCQSEAICASHSLTHVNIHIYYATTMTPGMTRYPTFKSHFVCILLNPFCLSHDSQTWFSISA